MTLDKGKIRVLSHEQARRTLRSSGDNETIVSKLYYAVFESRSRKRPGFVIEFVAANERDSCIANVHFAKKLNSMAEVEETLQIVADNFKDKAIEILPAPEIQ